VDPTTGEGACEVVSYDGDGVCNGWKTLTNRCEANGSWNTYTVRPTKFKTGSSDSDITEMWGDVDTVHFDRNNTCIQVEGQKVADHMAKENAWAKKNNVKIQDGKCDHEHWDK
jgi:hypothetical protein